LYLSPLPFSILISTLQIFSKSFFTVSAGASYWIIGIAVALALFASKERQRLMQHTHSWDLLALFFVGYLIVSATWNYIARALINYYSLDSTVSSYSHLMFVLLYSVIAGVVLIVSRKKKTHTDEKTNTQNPKETQKRNQDTPKDSQIQRLLSELSTRENSTLVVSTVAASASIAILAIRLESAKTEWFFLLFCLGFIFSLLGLLYREATVFGVEKENYEILNSLVPVHASRNSRLLKTLNLCRMLLVRTLLAVPCVAWVSISFPETTAETIVIFCAIVFSLSYLEYVNRHDPQ
jgi:hypothetical protein